MPSPQPSRALPVPRGPSAPHSFLEITHRVSTTFYGRGFEPGAHGEDSGARELGRESIYEHFSLTAN